MTSIMNGPFRNSLSHPKGSIQFLHSQFMNHWNVKTTVNWKCQPLIKLAVGDSLINNILNPSPATRD